MPIIFSLLGPVILLAVPFSDPSLEGEVEQILPLLMGMILFMLSLVPAIVPTIVASHSFVGEKVNRSLEPLLATPTTDSELLFGKILAAFLPTMAGTYIAFAINIVAIDLILLPVVGQLLLPNLSWAIAMFFFAPAIGITSIEANVLVSSRMSDVRAAQQVGGLIVMPVVLLFVGSLINVFAITPVNMLILSSIFGLTAFALFQVSRRLFQREKILTKWR